MVSLIWAGLRIAVGYRIVSDPFWKVSDPTWFQSDISSDPFFLREWKYPTQKLIQSIRYHLLLLRSVVYKLCKIGVTCGVSNYLLRPINQFLDHKINRQTIAPCCIITFVLSPWIKLLSPHSSNLYMRCYASFTTFSRKVLKIIENSRKLTMKMKKYMILTQEVSSRKNQTEVNKFATN